MPIRMSRRAFIAGATLFGVGIAIDQNDYISQYVHQFGISAIAAGRNFSVAVRDGRVYAWGQNNFGQCDVPWNLPRITQIDASDNHVVALSDDGEPFVWGGQKYQLPKLPAIVRVLAFSELHTVLLLADDYQTFYLLVDGDTTKPVIETYKWPVKIRHLNNALVDDFGVPFIDEDGNCGSVKSSYGFFQLQFDIPIIDLTSGIFGITAKGDVILIKRYIYTFGAGSTTQNILTQDELDGIQSRLGINIAQLHDVREIIFDPANVGSYVTYNSGNVTWYAPPEISSELKHQLMLPFPQETKVRYLVTGSSHVLALTATGALYAWGDNTHGACDIPRQLSL